MIHFVANCYPLFEFGVGELFNSSLKQPKQHSLKICNFGGGKGREGKGREGKVI